MRMSFFYVLFFAVFAPVALAGSLSCDVINENEPPAMLQQRLDQCQQEIQYQTNLLVAKERESTNLERDLAVLGYKISKSKLQINARELSIENFNRNIDEKSQTIDDLSGQIDQLKSSIAELIKKTNELEASSLAEVVLASQNISDFYQDLGQFDFLEGSIGTAILSINQNKSNQEKQKISLKDKQDTERYLKSLQEIEKRKQEVIEAEQKRILSDSKGQEQKYKQVLATKQKLVNEIKNRILKITGGGEMAFADALKLVRVAENAIGIRAAFVLSILTQESGMNGVIGHNVGKCFYNTPWNNLSATVMANSQKPSFLYIMQNLGLNPNTTPVSCPISHDGQYGGAMGPAQFMPKTWWDISAESGYKGRVESITKSGFASPFTNLDAFTGTALYLSDALDGCSAIYSTTFSRESCAAAKYYAGTKWKRYLKNYGKNVANRANDFQKDIDVIDSQ